MPSPQCEDGYTKIANELFEAIIRIKLTSNEKSVLLAIVRKTYGWGKSKDKISLTQLELLTSLPRPTVHKNIKSLVAKQLLVAEQLPSGNLYQIQKDYSTWISSRADTSSRLATTLVAKQLPVLVAKQLHTKEKKETIQKKERENPHPNRESVTEFDFQEISQKYNVPLSFVLSEFEDVCNWEDEKPGKMRGRNWRMTLMKWVKKDIIKIKQEGSYGRKTTAIDATEAR